MFDLIFWVSLCVVATLLILSIRHRRQHANQVKMIGEIQRKLDQATTSHAARGQKIQDKLNSLGSTLGELAESKK